MKKLFYIILGLFLLGNTNAQTQFNGLDLYSLSNGRYDEVHEYTQYERIGSAVIDMETMKIVSFVDKDSQKEKIKVEQTSTTRFLSLDPMARKYPFHSPYSYAANNPIMYIDQNGESPFAPIQSHALGMQQVNLRKQTYTQTQINNTARAEYAGYSVAAGVVAGLTPLDTYLDGASFFKNVATGNWGGAGLDALSIVGLDFIKDGKKAFNAVENVTEGTKDAKNTLKVIVDDVDKVDRKLLDAPTTSGNAPTFKSDGTSVEIHHVGQDPKGPFKEMHKSEHRMGDNYQKNHQPGQTPLSKEERKEFNKARREYWKNEYKNN